MPDGLFNISLDSILIKIFEKVTAKEKRDRISHLLSLTFKVDYEIHRLAIQTISIPETIKAIYKEENKNSIKSLLNETLSVFPVSNIDEFPSNVHEFPKNLDEVWFNYQTIVYRNLIDTMNRLAGELRAKQDVDLISRFLSLLCFIPDDNFMQYLGYLHKAIIIRAEEVTGISKVIEKDFFETIEQNYRESVDNYKKTYKNYKDGQLNTRKYLDGIKLG